jgi:ribosomal protein L11 methyltransferase
MGCLCISCTVALEQKDLLIGVASTLGMQGCVEEERPGGVYLQLYFDEQTSEGRIEYELFSRGAVSSLSVMHVADEDWNSAWRDSMEPILVTPHIWVSPQWLQPPLTAGQKWIRIEPKMAFGTGHHETTRLAASALMKTGGQSCLDIGTGSGILAFCALLGGYERITGVEIDPDCRENLAENLFMNSALHPHGIQPSFFIGTTDALKKQPRFDTIVMNMIYNHSAPLMPFVRSHVPSGGHCIWSGILQEGREEALQCARENAFALCRETTEDEWWCGVFKPRQ